MVCKMILPRFDFSAPASLPQTCALLAEAGQEALVLAGGTDLLVKMKRGELRPRLLLSLAGLSELNRVEASVDSGLFLGPLTTMSQLEHSPILHGPWRAIAEGAGSVGGPIIRNRATVGGNIVNARPCADTVPPLMALEARLQLSSVRGTREVELDGFISGPGQCDIQPDEILSEIRIPLQQTEYAGSCYLKITRRAAMEVTIVGCAASLQLEQDGSTVKRARIVLASVAPVLLRARQAEASVEGRALSDRSLDEAAALARGEAHPIDDHRAPAFYRSEMVQVLTRRALSLAGQRAKKGRVPS